MNHTARTWIAPALLPATRLAPALLALALALALLATAATAQELDDRVTEYTLDNGLRVLFYEDHTAPTIAFNLMFDVGGVDEPPGLGGIAHMVEHMAFKGTPSIGSADPAAEAAALAELELRAIALEEARDEGDAEDVEAALAAFAEARERANALGASSAVDALLTPAGAVGLNAGTGYDYTTYTVQLPANRLELYSRIYADILRDPTFRYFYEERDVVREERRQRTEDDPTGFLQERFFDEAFDVHPYGRPLIGPAAEIEDYLASTASTFFEALYNPNRAVLVLAGDVNPEEDIETIRRYFGTLESAPDLRPELPPEPEQTAERRFTVEYDAQPEILVGWHKPTYPNRDAFVLDLIDQLLSAGRTSRLYQRVILEDQSALSVSTSSAAPGTRYPNLFTFHGQPRAPFGPADLETALYDELDRLATEPVDEAELEKAKNQMRASIVRSLRSASGLASNLAYNELFAGGWERLVDDLEIYESITSEEIKDVAQRTFREENRTVGILLPPGAEQDDEQQDAGEGNQ